LEELHDEELNDEEESGDLPPPALLDAEEIEKVIGTLTERLAALSHKMILMQHTLNLLKVMMMKVACQIWKILMTMQVRKNIMLHSR
jgi:hypothetical protein